MKEEWEEFQPEVPIRHGANISTGTCRTPLQMYHHVERSFLPVSALLSEVNKSHGTSFIDKRIEEPVELIVNGRTVLRGRPAKSAGKYAVVITELSCDTE